LFSNIEKGVWKFPFIVRGWRSKTVRHSRNIWGVDDLICPLFVNRKRCEKPIYAGAFSIFSW
jgi:hypothetical protein